MTSRTVRRRVGAAAAMLALAGTVTTVAPASAASDLAIADRVELAMVKAATARYVYEPLAIADGYIRGDDDQCVEVPGLGAMGIHYVNPQRIGRLDPRRPDTLLYMPGPNGRRQLVGVEYFQADGDGNLGTDGDRPSLFGQPFDGPMPGHGPGQPPHYDLHAWLWRHNPAGMFAPFNPQLSC